MNHYTKIFSAVVFSIFLFFFIVNIGDFLYFSDSGDVKKRGYTFDVSSAEPFETEILSGNHSNVAKDDSDKPIPYKTLLKGGDVPEGKKLFRKCAVCHYVNEGKGHKIGPNLYGILGANPARHSDFKYSEAMLKMKDQKWSYQNLFSFLHNPRGYVPGTKMTFLGFKKYEDIADVIIYLKQFSPDAPELP